VVHKPVLGVGFGGPEFPHLDSQKTPQSTSFTLPRRHFHIYMEHHSTVNSASHYVFRQNSLMIFFRV